MKRLFVIVVLIATFLMACVKQTIHTDQDAPILSVVSPRIKLTSPQDFQRFSAGQTVVITATITDDEQLEKVHLLVINRATGAQVLRLEKNMDVKSYTLSESFIPVAGPRYTIKIEAVDGNNNNAKTQIDVSCN